MSLSAWTRVENCRSLCSSPQSSPPSARICRSELRHLRSRGQAAQGCTVCRAAACLLPRAFPIHHPRILHTAARPVSPALSREAGTLSGNSSKTAPYFGIQLLHHAATMSSWWMQGACGMGGTFGYEKRTLRDLAEGRGTRLFPAIAQPRCLGGLQPAARAAAHCAGNWVDAWSTHWCLPHAPLCMI